MLNKLLKSLLVISATVSATVVLGIVCFGRSLNNLLPDNFSMLFYPGLVLTLAGVLLSVVSAVWILRYYIFFTRTRVVDSEGNTLSDNKFFRIGSVTMPPVLAAAGGILISMMFIGIGFGMMFDTLTMYIINLLTFALLLTVIALIIFLFSVIKHKIRRRFAWSTSGIIGILALLVVLAAVPAISDLSVSESELSAITATVVQTSSRTGYFTGPGKAVIRIKGTSGEPIKLRYNGSRGSLKVGKKYTFYYLPHTHLIKKVNPADNVQY